MKLPFYKQHSLFTRRLVRRINELDLMESKEGISMELKNCLHCYKMRLVDVMIKRKQKAEKKKWSPALQDDTSRINVLK